MEWNRIWPVWNQDWSAETAGGGEMEGGRETVCVCVKGEGREKGIMDWEGRKIVR